MVSTTVLITGANRGIGLGLVQDYLSRPNTTVVATVRDPSSPSSKSLSSLSGASGSKIIVVKLDSSVMKDAADAIETLKSEHGLKKLDVIIANAGMAEFYGTVLDTPADGMREQYIINAIAPMVLFQAAWPLLQASSQPKFVTISTAVASVGNMENWPMPASAYGASKAGLNWITKKIHIENPSVIAFPLHPGWVQTDMGNAGAKASGMDQAPDTIKDSAQAIIKQVDTATREKTSGKFLNYDGEYLDW